VIGLLAGKDPAALTLAAPEVRIAGELQRRLVSLGASAGEVDVCLLGRGDRDQPFR